MQQIRALSSESRHPVNFLLFDYKGEFSGRSEQQLAGAFSTSTARASSTRWKRLCPFTPFADFTGRPINEINLYSTEMASALESPRAHVDKPRI